jgi:hypothetical protein
VGYDRDYSRNEIYQMLCDSEQRVRPGSKSKLEKGGPHQGAVVEGPTFLMHPQRRDVNKGHAISMHTAEREQVVDPNRKTTANDTLFSSRKELLFAVEEALKSPQGKSELATLKLGGKTRCSIIAEIIEHEGKLTGRGVFRRELEIVGKGKEYPASYISHLVVTSVVVVVDIVHPPESFAPLHIHTAYPNGFEMD